MAHQDRKDIKDIISVFQPSAQTKEGRAIMEGKSGSQVQHLYRFTKALIGGGTMITDVDKIVVLLHYRKKIPHWTLK